VCLRVNLASVTVFGDTPHGWVMTEFNWTPARRVGSPRGGY